MIKINIICFGHLWLGDDGFGSHVYQKLTELSLPQHVTLYEASILGMGALNCFEKCDKAIVVDAIDYIDTAGKIHRMDLEDIEPSLCDYTTHSMGLNYLLSILPIAFENQRLPKIVIYAAEIAKVSMSDQLSPPMQNALVKTVNLIEQELRAEII